MTFNGAIKQLHELRCDGDLPYHYRSVIAEVINVLLMDAQEVRHGHWDDMGDFESCSVCNGTHLKEYQTYYGKCLWIKPNYCPNCGAKMDEGREDGNNDNNLDSTHQW